MTKVCKCGEPLEKCDVCGVVGCPVCDFEAPYHDDTSIRLCRKCADEAREDWAQERAKVKADYEAACNEYLRLFCEKHEYDYDSARDSWIAGGVGGVTEAGGLCVNLSEIRTDIDRNAPADEFLKWYDYCAAIHAIHNAIPRDGLGCTRIQCMAADFTAPNYEHWLRGCARKSDAEIAAIEEELREDIVWRERSNARWAAFREEIKTMYKQDKF